MLESNTLKPLRNYRGLRKIELYNTERIREDFEYREGKIYRLRDAGTKWKRGQRAGTKCINGYRYVRSSGHLCLEHRIIWVLIYGENPDCDIDHINGIRDDNR